MTKNADDCFYFLNRIDLPLGEVGALVEFLIDSLEEIR